MTVGIVALIGLALVCAALIAIIGVKARDDAAAAARAAASYTPPPLASRAPAVVPTVVVIGDESVTESASGVSSAERWPARLDTALPGSVMTVAAAGSGYTKASATGGTYGDQAADIPSDAKVVVFFGGLNDVNAMALDVLKGATTAFSIAQSQAPRAKFLVVGPVAGGAISSSDVKALRSTLKRAALIARFTWIDPIGSDWIPDAATKQATGLTAKDEVAISAKLKTAVQAALG